MTDAIVKKTGARCRQYIHEPAQEHHFAVVSVAAHVAFVLERHERSVESLAFEVRQNDRIGARASFSHDSKATE